MNISRMGGRRVLFTARFLNSCGVTTYMATLGRALIRNGWEVGLCSSGQSEDHTFGPGKFESLGIRHFPVHFPGPSLSPSNLIAPLRAIADLHKAIRAFRPSLLHVHYRATSPFAAVADNCWGTPFVSTLHLDGIPATALHRLASFWGRAVFAVSSGTKQYLVSKFGVPAERVHMVRSCVDETRFRPPSRGEREEARRALGLASDRPVVCLIGRLEHVKGHDVLIRALADLRSRGVEVMAVCAGVGSERSHLQGLAGSLGVEDLVRFVGYQDSRTVLWVSDAHVLPSRREGFPLVLIEAMQCGVPSITTPTSGIATEIEDGVDALLLRFDDPADLAEKIRRVLDPEVACRVGRNGLRMARARFSEAEMVRQTVEVYQRVLAGSV